MGRQAWTKVHDPIVVRLCIETRPSVRVQRTGSRLSRLMNYSSFTLALSGRPHRPTDRESSRLVLLSQPGPRPSLMTSLLDGPFPLLLGLGSPDSAGLLGGYEIRVSKGQHIAQ
jgi:hypothetical protein